MFGFDKPCNLVGLKKVAIARGPRLFEITDAGRISQIMSGVWVTSLRDSKRKESLI
jgi:hypothetical protein